jgi:(E)-4-hydroxy-3-methylbut-2-enyl-diphosphate synthase
MKSSNPQVMVQAYRLLVARMTEEFGECYPLHLGVTEAGDGEDGRIKSAIGIGTLLEDGIGDTIRVSLTEDPEFEIPVCKDIVARYQDENLISSDQRSTPAHFSPYQYTRRKTFAVKNIGDHQVPVVIADLSNLPEITPAHLQSIGYTYDEATDKWNIADAAADYLFTGHQLLKFAVPGTLGIIVYADVIQQAIHSKENYYPIYGTEAYSCTEVKNSQLNFVMIDAEQENPVSEMQKLANDSTVVFCFSSLQKNALHQIRNLFFQAINHQIQNPCILICDSNLHTPDEHLIHFATETGALFLDGFGDGICLGMSHVASFENMEISGRTYLPVKDLYQFMNNTAFGILQASRTRISKTEYISCPSCGRTLFDLQETTAKIRAVTNHLKGVKIAIMGCIVNGPGEMADADFGYVGSGPGKITLYKNKDVVKKNIDSEIAVEELINLLKENEVWIEA